MDKQTVGAVRDDGVDGARRTMHGRWAHQIANREFKNRERFFAITYVKDVPYFIYVLYIPIIGS